MNDDLSFQSLIDTVQGGLILADPASGSILASNQLAAILLGMSQPELLGNNLFNYIDRPDVALLLCDLKKQGMLYNRDGLLMSASGRRFSVQLCLRTVEWSKPVLVFSFTDRSENQLLGELLKKKDQLFDQVKQLMVSVESERALDDPDDYLSGVLGMPRLLEKLAVEVGRAQRYGFTLTALQAAIAPVPPLEPGQGDMSYVKRVTGCLCVQRARDCDLVGRREDGSLLVVLPQTRLDGGMQLAQRLVTALGQLRFAAAGKDYALSACVGVSILHPLERSGKGLLQRLEVACNRAQGQGNNAIIAVP